jgi:predicted transcriptional regulator
MTKAILLSINPEHALNILNGKKTLELRKRVPKDFVGWVYVYVTKKKPDIMISDYTINYPLSKFYNDFNGTIPFRFWFDDYTFMKYGRWVNHKVGDWNYRGYMDEHLETFKKACLTEEEVNNYGDGKLLYAWHIKKLDIFSKPMQLSEFYKDGFEQCEYSPFDYDNDLETCLDRFRIKRAPQSFQYVWVKE